MAETLKQRLARLRDERNGRRANNSKNRTRRDALNRRIKAVDVRVRSLNAGIKKTLAAIKDRQRTPGVKAVDYLTQFNGRTEIPAGSNDAPFLAQWRAGLPTLAWMKGQPWCGFAVIAAYHYGAGKRLPDGVVFTPNIVAWTQRGQGFTSVSPGSARKGDLVVFNFPGGSNVADHVGLARGPAVNGVIPTIEGNTSSSDAGSQSNGGGVFLRSRPTSLIAIVARPV